MYIEDDYLTEAEPVAVSPEVDEGSSQQSVLVTGGGGVYVYQETSDFAGVVEDIPVSLLIKPLSRSSMTRSAKSLSCVT